MAKVHPNEVGSAHSLILSRSPVFNTSTTTSGSRFLNADRLSSESSYFSQLLKAGFMMRQRYILWWVVLEHVSYRSFEGYGSNSIDSIKPRKTQTATIPRELARRCRLRDSDYPGVAAPQPRHSAGRLSIYRWIHGRCAAGDPRPDTGRHTGKLLLPITGYL